MEPTVCVDSLVITIIKKNVIHIHYLPAEKIVTFYLNRNQCGLIINPTSLETLSTCTLETCSEKIRFGREKIFGNFKAKLPRKENTVGVKLQH